MATNAVLVDTGPMVAILDTGDAHHQACKTEFGKLQSPLFTCWPVITEAVWLLDHFPVESARFWKAAREIRT